MTVEIDEVILRRLVTLVATVAADEVLPHFRGLQDLGVSAKTGPNDLVTVADRAAERRLAQGIAALLPDARIVGEEAVSDDPDLLAGLSDSPLAVIVDPIDGTWNYARGLPVFGVNLAVVAHGRTRFALHYDPVTAGWIEARAGQGAYRCDARGNRVRLRIDTGRRVSVGIMPTTPAAPLSHAALLPLSLGVERVMAFGCSCHEYWLLAEGAADFLFADQTKPWDHCAGILIYTEAGGTALTLPGGHPYQPGQSQGPLLCARSPDLWRQLAGRCTQLLAPTRPAPAILPHEG